jgi:hypothetical protein
MTKDQKQALSLRRKRHNQDNREAKKLEAIGILPYPMNLPSLYRAVFGDGKPRWLTTGFDWIDKRHRVVDDAMTEIRILRAYILNNLK